MKIDMDKCKKVVFFTLGCKVNQYETDLMMKQFSDAGYEIIDSKQGIAGIYVVNSCSVTNLSTRKTRQLLSKAKRLGGIVVLVGCYAQEINDKNIDIKNVDLILGNEEKKEIVKYLEEFFLNGKSCNISDIANVKKYVQSEKLEKGINIRESIKIEDGCNNFCTYCIIPYLRGRVRSRSLEDIVEEVKNMVNSGVLEVVLVGIEIASYGTDLEDDATLVDVVEKVSKIDGLKQIRLGSLEPRILTEENIVRLSKIDKLCNHFHISVQSLDNEVLKRMNRKYTREFVFEKVELIRQYFDNPAFTCDIIVGFPGETDEEFENTIKGVEKIGFYEIHAFKYSKRKWTVAAKMENQVDGNVATRRSEELINLGKKLKNDYLKKHIGKKLNVLFESYSDGYLYGYTSNYIKVKVRGDKKLWGCHTKIELICIEEDKILGNICQ
jgi:threonylcarbamoyladenosine tRNA methylthiotransferase MtaB